MIEWYWVLSMMFFLHIIEDFYIQGILAQMKQRSWWKEQLGEICAKSYLTREEIDRLFGKDYYVPLILHGFMWSFIVSIPLMWFYGITITGFVTMCVMALIHSYIDNLKCNAMRINLIHDQILHTIQLVMMLWIWSI